MTTYALKTPLQSFVIATLGTVSGISFMLINVRVALGWAQTHPTTQSTTNLSWAQNHPTTLGTSSGATYPVIRSTKVHIDTTVDMKGDLSNGDVGLNRYELDAMRSGQV
jgi:hypothetical protein